MTLFESMLRGEPGRTAYVRRRPGFLRVKYDRAGRVANVAWSRRAGVPAERGGLQLFFRWRPHVEEPDSVTCRTARGMMGDVWSGGCSSVGTVWDDELDEKPRHESLARFVARSVSRMVVSPRRGRLRRG